MAVSNETSINIHRITGSEVYTLGSGTTCIKVITEGSNATLFFRDLNAASDFIVGLLLQAESLRKAQVQLREAV